MADSKKDKINNNVKKLDKLIQHFERAEKEFDLEADLAKYEEAMKLVTEVKKELEAFELKINEIKAKYSEEE